MRCPWLDLARSKTNLTEAPQIHLIETVPIRNGDLLRRIARKRKMLHVVARLGFDAKSLLTGSKSPWLQHCDDSAGLDLVVIGIHSISQHPTGLAFSMTFTQLRRANPHK